MIILAGATGNLGGRIARELRALNAPVRALIRKGTPPARTAMLQAQGVDLREVDFENASELTSACANATCVVSALSGLREVILDAQTQVLQAAVRAKVPRFIPSDYSIDYTELQPGTNRNFDLRREFTARLAHEPIRSTSIFNGAFADMLTGQMPLILFPLKRVLYWESADQKMDLTTMDDVAKFTAQAALDDSTPRRLHIAGDRLSARELAQVVSEVDRTTYKLFRAGSLNVLAGLIKAARFIAPQPYEIYPPWQGMQYMSNMFSGEAGLPRLDNDRYGMRAWTTAKDVLSHRPR